MPEPSSSASSTRTARSVFHQNLAAKPDQLLAALEPFRDDLVVACECMFAWYWVADLCATHNIDFVLGHALFMKAIHGGKTKNDKIDAHKIATLLRGGTFPQAYVYPKGMRETRDLLRRRSFFVRQRAHLIGHVQNTASQYQLEPFAKKLTYAANREELDILKRFDDPSVRRAVAADLALVDAYDEQIGALELHLTRTAKIDDPQAYHRLRSVPGIGPVLGLVLLYEIHDIRRFATPGRFLSYARLVKGSHESAGKKKGSPGKKMGNAHLKWAFSEAACLLGPAQRQGETLARTQHEEARQGAGPGDPVGEAGPDRVASAHEEGSLRRSSRLRQVTDSTSS